MPNIELDFANALSAFEKKYFSLAIKLFTEFKANYKDDPRSDFYLGMLYLETNNPILAHNFLLDYLLQSPNDATSWVALGIAYIILNRTEQAQNCFNQVNTLEALKNINKKLFNSDFQILITKRIQLMEKKLAAPVELLTPLDELKKIANQLHSDLSADKKAIIRDAYLKQYEVCIHLKMILPVYLVVNAGKLYNERNQPVEAQQALEPLLIKNRSYTFSETIYLELAKCYLAFGKDFLKDSHFSIARTQFTRILQYQANSLTAHYYIGITHLKEKSYLRALEHFDLLAQSKLSDERQAIIKAYIEECRSHLANQSDNAETTLRRSPTTANLENLESSSLSL